MSLLSLKKQKVLVGNFTEFQMFVLTLYMQFFSRYLHTYRYAYRKFHFIIQIQEEQLHKSCGSCLIFIKVCIDLSITLHTKSSCLYFQYFINILSLVSFLSLQQFTYSRLIVKVSRAAVVSRQRGSIFPRNTCSIYQHLIQILLETLVRSIST